MIRKKAQEEIIGFGAIVILVAIILLVFLGIFIRQSGSTKQESIQASQFLDSIVQYTTPCALDFEPNFLSLDELINKCSSQDTLCISGEKTCEVLNKTLSEILDSSWSASPEKPIKGYKFQALYSTNVSQETITEISKGDCSQSSSLRGADKPLPNKIVISLELCF